MRTGVASCYNKISNKIVLSIGRGEKSECGLRNVTISPIRGAMLLPAVVSRQLVALCLAGNVDQTIGDAEPE